MNCPVCHIKGGSKPSPPPLVTEITKMCRLATKVTRNLKFKIGFGVMVIKSWWIEWFVAASQWHRSWIGWLSRHQCNRWVILQKIITPHFLAVLGRVCANLTHLAIFSISKSPTINLVVSKLKAPEAYIPKRASKRVMITFASKTFNFLFTAILKHMPRFPAELANNLSRRLKVPLWLWDIGQLNQFFDLCFQIYIFWFFL